MLNKKGFTLIEILVVIVIIGILAGFSLTAFSSSRKTARDARRKADLEQIRAALEIYRADNGQYPPLNGGTWCTQISNSTYPQVKNALEGGGYISSVPQDPIYAGTYKDYFYRRINNNQYALYAELEMVNINDDFSGCARIGGLNNEYDWKVTNP